MKMFHLFHKPCSDQVRRLASFQSSYWTTCPPSDITVSWLLSLALARGWDCHIVALVQWVVISHANLKSSSLGTVVQQTKYRVHAVQTKCSGCSAVFYFESIYYFLYTFCSFSCLEPPPLIPHAVQVFRWEAGRSEVLLLYVFVLCFLPVLFNLASRICVTVTDLFSPPLGFHLPSPSHIFLPLLYCWLALGHHLSHHFQAPFIPPWFPSPKLLELRCLCLLS